MSYQSGKRLTLAEKKLIRKTMNRASNKSDASIELAAQLGRSEGSISVWYYKDRKHEKPATKQKIKVGKKKAHNLPVVTKVKQTIKIDVSGMPLSQILKIIQTLSKSGVPFETD